MNTTLVVNAKGGVGKTTISTNLASYFAAQGEPTTIADYDPQGSSLNWLRLRPPLHVPVHGADLAQRNGAPQVAGRRHIPIETRQLIMDAPAGPSRLLLQDLLSRGPQSILIPVAPSSIDVHATANFIRELLLVGHVRLRTTRVAVVANRVPGNRPVYEPLERFVASLKIPFIARLSDSPVYVEAAESGLGLFDLPAELCDREQREFLPVARWAQGLDVETAPAAVSPAPVAAASDAAVDAVATEAPPSNVIPFRTVRS